MLTFKEWTGINNVLPRERLGKTDLTEALNVDIGLSGDVRRRGGYSLVADGCHKNIFEGPGYLLATQGGALVALREGVYTTLHPAVSGARMWYASLPDGRTAWSNGNLCGITDGLTNTGWGVPIPEAAGDAESVPGALHPGRYRYFLTYTRMSDGLEGGAFDCGVVELAGGLLVMNLPVRDGFAINIYLSGKDGSQCYLAGTTYGDAFTFTGANDTLQVPCATRDDRPAPAGRLLAFWRTRMLIARGRSLHASLPHRWQAFDLARDVKQFGSDITLVQPVDDGIYVGTVQGLAFLGGTAFDDLSYRMVATGPVALGSGCAVPGEYLRLGDGRGQGAAMVCIVGGLLVGAFNGGVIAQLSQQRYRTTAQEVASAFRLAGDIPQYLAVPQ